MNPIELSRDIEERYRRYLKTTFYFKEPDLRASFEEALNSGYLSKGPYLEATSVFKRGQTPRKLFTYLLGSQLDEGFLKAIDGDRPLYRHQEQAIEGVSRESNVIVTTGTGSGKTESFLYPILLHLYREFQEGKLSPGVRALILYPMNALANDQRDRLGEISERLKKEQSSFRFTFGQYIGETPEDENDSWRNARDHMAKRLPGELVLRSEMRKTPPHILLTNYSMLEYLLLRPDDSSLFDNGQAQWWKFFVLDEAHQYRGSRGIEMAMLLRRLKQRLKEGGRLEPFRCIATSATLVGGEEGDKVAVAKFASDLFGEEFHKENVIFGETDPIREAGPDSLSPDEYRFLGDVIREKKEETRGRVAELATKFGISFLQNEDLMKIISKLLQRDSRATALRRLITGNPTEAAEVAAQIFADLQDNERLPALSELVELLLQARDSVSNAPLLSARYHLFLRSIEGAFVSYWPQKKVLLDRRTQDPQSIAFEVALCRECGQHYFVGPKDFKGGKLVEAIRDPSHVGFGATFFRPIEDTVEEDDEDDGKAANNKQVFQLCVQCGEMGKSKPKCGHSSLIHVVRGESPKDEDRADQMAKCGACGYNAAGRDPVREVVHGSDGPHAVIATALYQALPIGRKKVLAFADGRQEAAFFAWYLEDSYKDILSRNLILKITKSFTQYPTEGISLSTIADRAFKQYQNAFKQKESDDEPTIRKNIWRALYREFLTDEQRLSLEGVGLVRWSINWPNWFKIPGILKSPPWSLTEQEAYDVVFILLNSMRTDMAAELQTENGVSLNWSDLGLQTSQRCISSVENGRLRFGERKWAGVTGKRIKFLIKLLYSLPKEEAAKQAVNTLRTIWDTLRTCDENATSSHNRLLFSIDDSRRINPDWWRIHIIRDNDSTFQCEICGRLQTVSVRAVCSRHHCSGSLKEIRAGDLNENHYRLLYKADLPDSLRVEEHTAQLDKEKAREFQREFKEGKIHVLSCSTTFELGVDLGNLDTIFLRNVPPEAFNYTQRVGRAGRRSGYPGFAITYCRRGPHDLYHFSEPQRMLKGRIRPPVLSLQNEKIIARHIVAMALSAFFRAFPERFKSVESLFKNLVNPSGVADFKLFLEQCQTDIERSLRAVVPADMIDKMGLQNKSWIDKVSGDESRFSLAEAEISNDYRAVRDLEVMAVGKEDYDTAKWAKERAKHVIGERVLDFISRKAVIPKYGFPVDVVELDAHQTHRSDSFAVSLQRDLSIAIAEFAPTSKLVANKKEWTSYGLKRVVGKEWDRWWYARCIVHNRFERKPYRREKQNPFSDRCCDRMVFTQYIDPKFGFVTSRDKPEDPKARASRVFTTRPYFADFKGKQGDNIDHGIISLTTVSPGYLVVLCEGRRGEGFYVCSVCGAGFRKCERPHKTPFGQDCNGTLEQVSLGHEFVTDVLKLQFHLKPEEGIEPIWFAHSLAYALVEGAAEVLEVPSTDLSATVAHSEQDIIPPIILYDNVPGGAGLVARLLKNEKDFVACLNTARARVSGNCGCAESTSCYGCLRSYRNQFAHQHLNRGTVYRYLGAIISQWK